MMKMAMEFFENSRIASTLCGTLLQSIDEASDQCRYMEAILAGMPHSGEALGFMQQTLMVESLSQMVNATNPFAKIEACKMFADVAKRYGALSSEVEERRKVVGRKARVIRRWRGGCVAVVVAVVVGATVVAVVVATHVAVTMAGAAPVVAAATVARSKSLNERNSRRSNGVIGRCGHATGAGADGVGGSCAGRDVETGANSEGAGTGRVEIELIGKELAGIATETGSNGVGVRPVGVEMSGIGRRMGGVGLEEDRRDADGADTGRVGARRGGGHGCFCWGLGMLTKQSSKLDALARGSFTVNRMLDTLRCLVTGLQDDVERNRRLVEFGWRHREEAKCVQQVGKQLFRSHSHMVRQLANLQEQVIVCFLIINKARDIVLQEFSPSSPKT